MRLGGDLSFVVIAITVALTGHRKCNWKDNDNDVSKDTRRHSNSCNGDGRKRGCDNEIM